jgi:Tol biopolymer transport system component
MSREKRIIRILAGLLILLLIVVAQSALSQQSAEDLYEAALLKKEAEGDLNGAIEIFQRIVKIFPQKRDIAAKAQLQIGLCYEKLGLEEAPKAFQKVIDNYPDQSAVVETAKAKLSKLSRARKAAESGDSEFRIRKIGPFEVLGAPSPDGRLISTVDWTTGDLALFEIDTGKTRRLTKKGSWAASYDFAEESIFSPDGKSVVYNWFKYENLRFDLRRINTDGTGQEIIYSNKDIYFVWPCGWTPDEKHILAILTDNDKDSNRIVLISVTDGTIRTIKEFKSETSGRLCLSPDGQWIAYDFPYRYLWQENPGKRDLFLLSIDGRREVPLVAHPADDRLLGWSPDGQWILFSSNRSGTYDAWIQSIEDGTAKGNPLLVKRDFGDQKTWQMGFTREGQFYFGLRTSQTDIYVVSLDPETGGPAARPEKAALRFEGSNASPCWSPDGNRLAYTSFRNQDSLRPRVLCVKSMISGEEQEFYPDIADFNTVGWFPDGESVLCCGRVKGNRLALVRVELAGAEPETHLILDDFGVGGPLGGGLHGLALSRDGKRVFYDLDDHSGPTFRVVSYHIETRQKKELIRGREQIIHYDISPDGQWLVFKEGEDGRACLKLIASEGGEKKILLKLEKGEGINGVSWSPDGKHIFFSKRRRGAAKTGPCDLWSIPKEGGKPVKYELTANGMGSLGIHPDGKRLVFNSWELNPEVWVMENFLPVEKK